MIDFLVDMEGELSDAEVRGLEEYETRVVVFTGYENVTYRTLVLVRARDEDEAKSVLGAMTGGTPRRRSVYWPISR